jgi:hypothetical protein
MLKHVYLIFASTFLLGVVLGAIVFLAVPRDESPTTPRDSGYTIAVYTYGGCERLGCPLYRITQTGEYIYIANQEQADGTRETGTLPLSERRKISDELADANLSRVEASRFTDECPVNVDGLGYRFDIQYDGEQYRLDSCVHDTTGVMLFETLAEYVDSLAPDAYGAQ